MSEIDILAALEAAPSTGERRCKLGRLLDEIPAEAPGREKLLRIAELNDVTDPDYRTVGKFAIVLSRLGSSVGEVLIGDHRKRECICYR